jgi:hypothetical protein
MRKRAAYLVQACKKHVRFNIRSKTQEDQCLKKPEEKMKLRHYVKRKETATKAEKVNLLEKVQSHRVTDVVWSQSLGKTRLAGSTLPASVQAM